jgi:hypothetical protein
MNDVIVKRTAYCERSETTDFFYAYFLSNNYIKVLVSDLLFFDSSTTMRLQKEKAGTLTLIWAQQWIASVLNRSPSGIF